MATRTHEQRADPGGLGGLPPARHGHRGPRSRPGGATRIRAVGRGSPNQRGEQHRPAATPAAAADAAPIPAAPDTTAALAAAPDTTAALAAAPDTTAADADADADAAAARPRPPPG